MSGAVSGDRASKRQKAGEPMAPNGSFHQPPHPYPPQQAAHFRQPYGGPPPPPGGQFAMQAQAGYMWQHGQQQPPPYGNQPPVWGHGQQPPPQPMGMYRQGGPPNGMPPEQPGNWNGFRGHPQQPPPQMGAQRPPAKQATPPRSGAAAKDGGGPPGHPQQQQQQGYWGPQQQWPQHQWGNGPPMAPMWQGGPPMQQPNMPQHLQGQQLHMPAGQHMWQAGRPGSGMTSPPRPGQPPNHPRGSPDMMGGYPQQIKGMDIFCQPTMDGAEDTDPYMGRPKGQDGKSRGGAASDKDKGRGSYRCGRCGAPKKGHICPYQPKLKRRPDEPPPEMRNAAVQVEMDEFMTLRRLNIEIQGFPESYATGPQLNDNMVVGEPHPYALGSSGVLSNSVVGDPRSEVPMSNTMPMHKQTSPIESDLRISPRASPTGEAQA